MSRPATPGSKPSQSSDPAFEIEEELRRMSEILSGNHARSLLVVGPPGSGKSAAVRELARRRSEFGFGQTPFWTTDAARLMSGPVGFGMWQERCRDICREVAKARGILHLSNLAELMEVGKATRTGQSVGGFLRPWIARGDVLAIAECTPEQLGAIERNEPALAAAFHAWHLPPRTPRQSRAILGRVHEAAPGKEPTDSAATTAALDRLHSLHERYAAASASPGRQVRFLRNLLADGFPSKQLTEADVLAAFSRETGLPRVLLDDDETLDLDATRAWLEERVVGQPEAAERILDLLAAVKARLSRPHKPLASLLFIGPTGTGKTEMAKALAEFLYGDAGRMVRFDLNEFTDPFAVQRLIGGPATGGAEGLLTARVREQPFGVILLDEFEKADPSFFDLLLQLLGDGRLTDAAGRVADFSNSVVVMTSNLGAQEYQAGPVGFRGDELRRAGAREHFTSAVRRFLRPEIFNRIDAIVPYLPLDAVTIRHIVNRQLALIRGRDGLRFREVELVVGDEVASHLAGRGFDARYGARPLRRAVEREFLAPLAGALNRFTGGIRIRAEARLTDGRVDFDVRAVDASAPAPGFEAGTMGEAGRAAVGLRRATSRLLRCEALSAIDDEIALLETVERRAPAETWVSDPQRIRLEKLRGARRAARTLHEDACSLEEALLVPLFGRNPGETGGHRETLAALGDRWRRIGRDLFRLQAADGDEIALAFHAEPREFLGRFAGSYLRLAARLGRIEAAFPIERTGSGRKTRIGFGQEALKEPLRWVDSVPENAWGLVVQLRGELFRPMLGPEAGLHVFDDGGEERLGWVRMVTGKLSEYRMPEEILQTGKLRALAGEPRRTFKGAKERVLDSRLGERPCTFEGRDRCLLELTSEWLELQVRHATGQREAS